MSCIALIQLILEYPIDIKSQYLPSQISMAKEAIQTEPHTFFGTCQPDKIQNLIMASQVVPGYCESLRLSAK